MNCKEKTMATPVPQRDDVEHWTVEQVAAWLQQMQLSECCDIILRKGIDGHKFLQLSEEELFHWGKEVPIRNWRQILKLVNQIKSLQQHPCTSRQAIETSRYMGSQQQKNYHNNGVDHAVKDFSHGEEETEECGGQEAPPVPLIPPWLQGQLPNMVTCSSFPRPNTGQNNILHGPGPRSLETHNDDTLDDNEGSSFDDEEVEEHPGQKMKPVKENDQGEESIDDLYLVPLQASPPTNRSNIKPSNQLPSSSTNSSIAHQHGRVPWNQHSVKKERLNFGSDTQNNRKSRAPAIPERIPRAPAPLPGTLTASHKQPSPLHFQALTPNLAINSSLQGANISLGLPENASNGVKGGSSQRWQKFPSSTLPRRHTDNELSQAHLPTQSLEKNDHVYEIVDIPEGSFGGTEIPGPNMSGFSQPDLQSPSRPPIPPPRNQNQDFNDIDLSSKLGPVSLSHGKRPPAPLPPLARKPSEGHITSQARTPAPNLPNWTDRSRQPKAPPSFLGNSSQSSHKTFPQESHAPQEISTKPTESVSLGNGECIELTPLYKMIMEKPYFQFVSRSKAKELVLQGGEGTFLIRPSTRTEKPLTLTVKHNDRSYNINIRKRPDGLFALGNEKVPERTFSSIDEIVFTHYKEHIALENGECALLKYSPSKPRNVYVQHVISGR